jgi:CheY-like chemotaxis protein
LRENSNSLDSICDPDIGTIRSDITKARQSLVNLLSNACKFTDHGEIILEVTKVKNQEGEWIKFCVKDNGIGMTEDQMDKLFQSFSQADASTTRKYGGTGLGLAISKRLCELLGGNIYAYTKPNEGSTFTMMLPTKTILSTQVDETLPSPASVRFPHDLSRLIVNEERRKKISTVLIIDDDPNVRNSMKRILTKEGFRVETAYNGQKGLEMAREIRPDVITLDVMMPDISGWAILKSLKKDPDLTGIPVIMLTMVDAREKGLSHGASEYIIKPVQSDRLSDAVKKCLRKKP